MPARTYYGIIISGMVFGMACCASAGWFYLHFDERKPVGRQIWDGIANEFVLPISIVIGATFGGLWGVAMAVIGDRRIASRSSNSESG